MSASLQPSFGAIQPTLPPVMGVPSSLGARPPLPSSMRVEVKAPTAFRTISEVATNLDVPQHVLRFWESKFQQIKPLKRGGGRRYYRPEDVTVLANIKELLYGQGFTIRGVQKLLKENPRAASTKPATTAEPVAAPVSASREVAAPRPLTAAARREIEGVLGELKALRELLRQSGV